MRSTGWFVLLGQADPLRGETRPVEERLLEMSGGVVLFVAPRPMLPLVEAWREIFHTHGARHTGVLALSRREQAMDPRLAGQVADAPLVLLVDERGERLLELIEGSRLVQALASVHLRGGVVAAALEASPLLGSAVPLGGSSGPAVRYGLGLLPGLTVQEAFEGAGAFHRLSEVVIGRPDLLGLGLERGAAVLVGPEGRAEVVAGRVALLDASAVRSSPAAVHGLRVDVLASPARFEVPLVPE
ncbi:MAG TPA: cyanophycinase [Oceanithermus profundus]|uniref:Cyanophycinase n=1 Tax=Oceanithermus profundus TaxID=187137 RepID=A0A7C4Z6B9_9DEIN|nr:cyanophycinase [Oceanithermus profundus]